MSLNWKEIDLILEELDLEGSFIQQIVQPSYDTIALHTYKSGTSKTVLVCLAGGACRIHQTWTAVPKNNKPLRFMEFLKARIKGARINAIRQLGQERIIKLELSHCGQEFLLYIRLWSNAANIILTDPSGCILDSFYRRPGKGAVTGGIFSEPTCATQSEESDSFYRRPGKGAVTGGIFSEPTCATQSEESDSFYRRPGKGEVTGGIFSEPTCATQSEESDSFYRRPGKGEVTGGIFSEPTCATQSEESDSFYRRPGKGAVTGGTFSEPTCTPAPQTEEPAPHQSPDKEQKQWRVRDFRELPDSQELSFNQKVDRWYREHGGQLSLESLLEQAQKFYTSRHSKMEAALHRLEKKRDSFLQNQQWKHYGDLILSYGHLIDGSQDYLECQDYHSGATIRIKIDPKKNAQENAATYYSTYKKSVSGLADLEYDIQKARRELLDLEATYQQLCKEPNPIRLQQLLRKQTRPKQQEEKKRPGLSYEIDGWTIFVGRTASENDELLRHHVKGLDYWFHTRDVAGGYVFVKNRPGKTLPLKIMLCAGNLAVHHSKARKAGEADLYYTQVKHLRRAKNGPKGLVLPSQEKNLFIQLDKDILKELESTLTS